MLVLQVVLYFIARNRFYYSSFCFKTYFYRARHSGLLFAAPTVCRGRTNLSSLSSFNHKGFLLQSNWNWLLLNNLWCWEREGYNLSCFFVLNISPWRRQGMSVWCLCRRCCSTGICIPEVWVWTRTEHLKGCPVPYLFLVLYLSEVFAVKDDGFMSGNIGMPYGVACKFVPSIQQFQSLESCLLELAYALCCPVLAETHKDKKKSVLFWILAISCNSRINFSWYLCVVLILVFDELCSCMV